MKLSSYQAIKLSGYQANGLTAIGVDPKGYGSHSGRRGGATAASEQGVVDLLIKRQGINTGVLSRYTVISVLAPGINHGQKAIFFVLVTMYPVHSDDIFRPYT